ncbi:MAG: Rpn family recombination-promoting nuclease/putative transposase [Spirochaetaceae bacterium]|nr:Rpn family recombination-promoting nuclease/putative transposase [Spirochaetaceae bacterium]
MRIFSDSERLRELYNAISGSACDASVPLEINTLSEVLFKDRKNDISFLLGNKIIVLIEHQSTISPNMPLRILGYATRIYEKIIKDKQAIYRRTLLKIPRPEFYVLYNGPDEYPEKVSLKLSDAFTEKNTGEPALELNVSVYNINKGKNPYLAEKCKTLDEYETLVAKAREFHAEFEGLEGLGSTERLEKALGKAINWCIEHGILKDFLEENSTEVNNMLFTEWNWDDALEVAREEGIEQGRGEGIEVGIHRGIEVGIDRGIEKGINSLCELLEQGYTPKAAKEMLKNKSGVRV